MKKILFALALVATSAFAGPYVGIEHQYLSGTRSDQNYQTNQASAVFGYEWKLNDQINHGVEYTGPVSSSTGSLGGHNVETVLNTLGYRIKRKGLFAKIAVVKFDRDDADFEANSDLTSMYVIGYEYTVDQTTSLRVSYNKVISPVINTNGVSVGAIFRFK